FIILLGITRSLLGIVIHSVMEHNGVISLACKEFRNILSLMPCRQESITSARHYQHRRTILAHRAVMLNERRFGYLFAAAYMKALLFRVQIDLILCLK